MIIHPGFIGIDVSKHYLDVFDARGGRTLRYDNSATALAGLIAGWDRDAFVLFEATGVYDLALRRALGDAGIRFARVNPARARDFARAAGFLAKTDAVDARMLAAMAQCLSPQATAPACDGREQLARLNKRRDQLVATRQQERTRARECRDAVLHESIKAHLRWLDDAIAVLQDRIAALIADSAELASARRLMISVPGVGPVTAATLLALLPEIGQRSPKRIAALAGLAPFNNDSGLRRGQRTIKGGRRRVREALYMAAVSAARHSQRLRAAYQALRNAGKPAKLALIAIARKLLTILNAIVRDQTPFRA